MIKRPQDGDDELSLNVDKMRGAVFSRILSSMSNQVLMKIDRICVERLSTFEEKFARAGVPVIIDGLISARARDQDHLLRKLHLACGDMIVQIRAGRVATYEDYDVVTRTSPGRLGQFIDQLRSGEALRAIQYIGHQALPPFVLSRLITLQRPPSLSDHDLNEPRMWLGPAGTITPLHKDVMDNFCYHLFGVKKWTIFSPLDYSRLYMMHPDAAELPDFAISHVNVEAPDLDRYPLFAEASPLEFFVSGGETLYLPAGWAHHVECIETSMMINRWVTRARSPAILGARPRNDV